MPAIAVHHTGTETSAWDGPAAVAAMPAEKATLHYCHAWQAAGAGDEKGGYKFPHHRKQGGPANIPACHNALSRLAGANIPDADRAGVRSHVQAHINDHAKKTGGDNLGGFAVANLDVWARAASLGNLTNEARLAAHAVRVQQLSARADWFRLTDSTDGVAPATLHLYDEIGFWGVTAADFQQALVAVSGPSLTVHINSPGGDVFDGIAILNMLRAHPLPVNVVIDGLAASAASFIAQAGDTVTAMPNSQMMIHDASGVVRGNQADMLEMASLLDKVSDNIASVYAKRAGGDVADWRAAMRAESWYTADEAVAAGLADTVGEVRQKTDTTNTASGVWNFSSYTYHGRAHAPAPKTPAADRAAAPVYDSAALLAELRTAFTLNPKEAAQ
jgi:ATP-dependent protease ClpP protease subunit